jgi:hypothetical protein
MVKVHKIVDADRSAGWGTQEKPPELLIGKDVKIKRDLINWHGHIATHDGKDDYFAHEELFPGDCNCGDCADIRERFDNGKKD